MIKIKIETKTFFIKYYKTIERVIKIYKAKSISIEHQFSFYRATLNAIVIFFPQTVLNTSFYPSQKIFSQPLTIMLYHQTFFSRKHMAKTNNKTRKLCLKKKRCIAQWCVSRDTYFGFCYKLTCGIAKAASPSSHRGETVGLYTL